MKKQCYLLLFLPFFSQAHDNGLGDGFIAGFTHPVLGLDHLLAMLSVGILSMKIGKKAMWLLPVSFVVMMFLGAVLGFNGFELLSVETSIALSVIILGIMIAYGQFAPFLLSISIVSFFALFHGYAHGSEIPYLADVNGYIIGFMSATIIIHLIGIVMTFSLMKLKLGTTLLKYIGLIITLSGLPFLIN